MYPLLCVMLWTVGCYACKSLIMILLFPTCEEESFVTFVDSQIFDELKTKDLYHYIFF